jgi:predicted O-methyltransferase YrrM
VIPAAGRDSHGVDESPTDRPPPMFRQLTRMTPAAIKDPIKRYHRDHRLRRAVEAAYRTPPGEMPPALVLDECAEAWGYSGFRAGGGFVDRVAREALTTPGPVLEIGSGLTTILLGLLAGRRGVQTWSLEHWPDYHRSLARTLTRSRVTSVRTVLAPLKDHGEYAWYDSPDFAAMPRNFRLVIADGPPGDTKGGRYGLLPIMKDHLAPDALIVLDDAERPGEQAVLQRWKADFNLASELHWHGDKAWAVCRFAAPTSAATVERD